MALRAAKLVPLSTLAREGHAIMPEFWGMIGDQRVYVTAVLERTVVYVDGAERRLTKRENCLVDPADIELREVTTSISWRSRGKAVAAAAAANTKKPEVVAEEPDAEAEPDDSAIEDLDALEDDEDSDEPESDEEA